MSPVRSNECFGLELLGAGEPRTVHDLCSLVKQHHPKLVFLSETKMSDSRASNLRWRLGLRNYLAVSSNGLSGGLALFWDENLDISLLSQGERYIDVGIKEDLNAAPWRTTFVYEELRAENRSEMWDLLRDLCGVWDGPWMVIGDFNEAMWQYEHFSETPRSERHMMDFREVLSHCDLHDLGFSGLPWTYNNNQTRQRNVRVRLDRGVANTDWCLSHRIFQRKPSAYLYACQDQVSCIWLHKSEYRNSIT
jgi:hypothetical protein